MGDRWTTLISPGYRPRKSRNIRVNRPATLSYVLVAGSLTLIRSTSVPYVSLPIGAGRRQEKGQP